MLYKTNEMLCLRSNQWPVHIDTDTELHTTVCLLSMHQRKEAGIDVSIFKAHSVKGASTTAPLTKGVSVADILHTADWSSDTTFRHFYYRPLGNTYSHKLLKHDQKNVGKSML